VNSLSTKFQAKDSFVLDILLGLLCTLYTTSRIVWFTLWLFLAAHCCGTCLASGVVPDLDVGENG